MKFFLFLTMLLTLPVFALPGGQGTCIGRRICEQGPEAICLVSVPIGGRCEVFPLGLFVYCTSFDTDGATYEIDIGECIYSSGTNPFFCETWWASCPLEAF